MGRIWQLWMYRYPSAYTLPEEHLVRFCQTAVNRNGGKKEPEQGRKLELAAAEALRGEIGVCQDYAHILISICRYAGIPARYVAGLMMGEILVTDRLTGAALSVLPCSSKYM